MASGDDLIGPFDGKAPAEAFVREMRKAGATGMRARRVYPPGDARLWAKQYAPAGVDSRAIAR